MILLLFLLLVPETLPSQIVATGPAECLILRDDSSDLVALVNIAVRRFSNVRIQGGDWEVVSPILLDDARNVVIRSNPGDVPVFLRSKAGPVFQLRRAQNVTLESLILEGGVEMEQTDSVVFRSMTFRKKGLYLRGRRCNQPNECIDYHSNLVVEDSTFVDADRGIFAERLEGARIRNNRFQGEGSNTFCERAVAIELDGKTEDLDRRLEYGRVKANHITANTFEQPFATGIRLRYTQANVLRDNRFENAFRAMEFLEGAKFNQVQSNYIGYLSQEPASSACPVPCGIYAGMGAFNNVFYNNFFEQDFELQFLERHRNRLFVVDESGGRNVFRSDFLSIRQ